MQVLYNSLFSFLWFLLSIHHQACVKYPACMKLERCHKRGKFLYLGLQSRDEGK